MLYICMYACIITIIINLCIKLCTSCCLLHKPYLYVCTDICIIHIWWLTHTTHTHMAFFYPVLFIQMYYLYINICTQHIYLHHICNYIIIFIYTYLFIYSTFEMMTLQKKHHLCRRQVLYLTTGCYIWFINLCGYFDGSSYWDIYMPRLAMVVHVHVCILNNELIVTTILFL